MPCGVARRIISLFWLFAPLSVAAASCSAGGEACTPSTFGLGAAKVVTPSSIYTLSARPCVQPGVVVIDDQTRLTEVLTDLEASDADAGASDPPVAIPSLDFAIERAVVIEHPLEEGISWSVVDGDNAVFALLRCASANLTGTCAVSVLRLSAVINTGETRTCSAVSCTVPSIGNR